MKMVNMKVRRKRKGRREKRKKPKKRKKTWVRIPRFSLVYIFNILSSSKRFRFSQK